jgi:N-acetyltransferase
MNFDRQPTLAGNTLTLRPMHPNDWDALYAVASDPLIWELHPVNTRHEEPVFRGYFSDGLTSGGGLVVIDRATGQIIGASRYSFDNAGPGEIEIGWTFLARSHWGGTFNREMKRLMLAHAFGSLGRVLFMVGDSNLRSRRAMEKIGGILTERLQTVTLEGREITHVIYAIEKDDFDRSALNHG